MDTYIAKSTPTAKSLTGRAAALIAARESCRSDIHISAARSRRRILRPRSGWAG